MSNDDFAHKLDYLLRTYRKPDGKPFTYAEIVEKSNGRLTISNLSQLRHGHTKPGYEVIQALCEIFGIEPNYFFDIKTTTPLLEPKPIHVDEEAMQIAFRAQELDTNGRKALWVILNYLSEARK